MKVNLIRFCLQQNEETKVVEIKNNGESEVTFNMKQKEINDQEIEKWDYKKESIQLEGFVDSNTLLLKQRRDPWSWWLFLIDLKGWLRHRPSVTNPLYIHSHHGFMLQPKPLFIETSLVLYVHANLGTFRTFM